MTAEQRVREAVNAHLAKWQEPLGLNRWLLTINWTEDTDESAAYATCDPNPEYWEATLTFNVPLILRDRKTDRLEYIVVHELFHCHTAATAKLCQFLFDELLRLTEERATTALERMPLVTDRLPPGT